MNWDQIESKWAAMTRRVRADWPTNRPDAMVKVARRIPRPEVKSAILAERSAGTLITTRQKTSNE
jgi:hypothetical protein